MTFNMAASSSILSMGEEYVLPSANSSKPYQYLVDAISLDHNYCRPWSEREKIPHARPAKELFLHLIETESEDAKKSSDKKLTKSDDLIDVETVEEQANHGPSSINMQYDVMKSKIVMSECEKYVSSASSKRTPDTWEELICRTGWTNQQNVLFDKILKIVSAYRLSWLTYEGSINEPILRRIAVDKATKRVRQILSRIEWDTKLTTWLHSSMVDGLSIPLLACYLDIIQTLRSKVPTLVDKMIAGGTTRRVSAGTTDNLTALLKRPWDATVGLTSFQRPRKITGTPLLLIVPSGPTTSATGNSTKRSRFWHHHLSHFGKVIPVTMHLSNSGRGVSIGQCLDHMIGAVQAKVLELKNHFPNRPVVLIGWATGALVSFQVSLKESVCAVVCLGFPIQGVEGLRGGAGDPFLDSKTPAMFVFGSLSTSCSLPDIEEFRKKLLSDTSLLVIGGADDQLRLTSAKKKMEGVTQSVVDRRVMDDIGEFLNLAVSSMNDDSHPRLDYFDFDEVETTRRKKPKSEYRKRPAGDGTGSATPAKKPRGRAPKAANGEGNGTKKPKPVKTVKKTPVNKPVVLVSGSGQTTGASVPAVRPSGSIPIAPLRATHPSIPSGILQGVPLTSVSVPISAVGVPLTGVPVSRVSIPGVRIPGVNIPVSGVNVPVSAVIKQGSLGGRSFVFPGAASNVGSPNPGLSSAAITTMGTSGNTHHLKIVMNPSTDGRLKVTGPPTTMFSDSQSAIQYKTAILTAPVTSKPTAPVTETTANPTSVASTTFSSSSVVTSLPMTSSAVTSSAKASSATKVPSQGVTSQGVTSLASSSVTQQSSAAGCKPIVVSRTVVTVPKSAIISGQAQFIMHQGQLSAVGKQATMRQSSSGNATVSNQQKPIPQGPRVNTPTGTKPQTTVSSTASKQTTVRVTQPGSTQAVTNLVRKTSSPQSMTRTIQVGVKRTVTYNPSTPSKTITVVSRSLPSEVLTTQVSNISAVNLARLKARLKSIQTLPGVQTGAQIETVQLKTSQALANSATKSAQNIPSKNTAQTTARPTEASSAQNSPKVITSSIPQSSASSIVPSSLQGTAKSSTQTVSTPSLQTMLKSSVETLTLSTPTITSKSTAQVVQTSTQALSSSSAHSSSTSTRSTEKLTPLPSTKSATQLIQPVPPTTGILTEPTSQGAAKSCAQSTTKPTTHFIQVPASTKVLPQNTVKSSAQSLMQSSVQSIQSSTPASTQSVMSSSATSRATDVISVTSQKDKPNVTSQKDEPIVEKAATNQLTQPSDASSSLGSMSEERLVEKINNIVNDVLSGNQRTTRQSVRRLVAAAKLAEAQHKSGESDEGSKEQNTKTK